MVTKIHDLEQQENSYFTELFNGKYNKNIPHIQARGKVSLEGRQMLEAHI